MFTSVINSKRVYVLCLLLSSLANCLGAEENRQFYNEEGSGAEEVFTIIPEFDMSESMAFNGLSEEGARAKAVEMVEDAIRQDRTVILVYGLRPGTSLYEEYLCEKYGIQMRPIAGCLVSEGDLVGAKVFNEVMKAYLFKKHGRDVFGEAATAFYNYPKWKRPPLLRDDRLFTRRSLSRFSP